MSRTSITPRRTRTNVPSQRSAVIQVKPVFEGGAMHGDVVSPLDGKLEALQIKVGIGQSLARDRNEQDKLSRPSSRLAAYGCECGAKACEQVVSLTAEEYEGVRRV